MISVKLTDVTTFILRCVINSKDFCTDEFDYMVVAEEKKKKTLEANFQLAVKEHQYSVQFTFSFT